MPGLRRSRSSPTVAPDLHQGSPTATLCSGGAFVYGWTCHWVLESTTRKPRLKRAGAFCYVLEDSQVTPLTIPHRERGHAVPGSLPCAVGEPVATRIGRRGGDDPPTVT